MRENGTFMMLKPDVVAARRIGNVLAAVEARGFKIEELLKRQLLPSDVNLIYREHVGKAHYARHRDFMLSGPVLGVWIQHPTENAVTVLRELAGATDPRLASEGTLRRRFGQDLPQNAVHASDSVEAAHAEAQIFFDDR